MRRRRKSQEQIIYALRQVEAGAKIGDVCRQLGVAEQTYFRWKKQYAGLGVREPSFADVRLSSAGGCSPVTLHLPCGARLEVATPTEATWRGVGLLLKSLQA